MPQLDLPTSIQQVRIGFVRSVCLLEQCGVSRWVAKLERGVGVLGGQCGEDEQHIALGGRFRFGHGLDLRAAQSISMAAAVGTVWPLALSAMVVGLASSWSMA